MGCAHAAAWQVREATGLDADHLNTLLEMMDDENKLMCRQGVVYLL